MGNWGGKEKCAKYREGGRCVLGVGGWIVGKVREVEKGVLKKRMVREFGGRGVGEMWEME